MVTNHGTFGNFDDEYAGDRYSTKVAIYHSFLKLQGQWVTTPAEADRVAGDEAEGYQPWAQGKRHRRLRYIKPPQGRVTAGPRTKWQASLVGTLMLGKGGGRRPGDSKRRECGSAFMTITILPQHHVCPVGKNMKKRVWFITFATGKREKTTSKYVFAGITNREFLCDAHFFGCDEGIPENISPHQAWQNDFEKQLVILALVAIVGLFAVKDVISQKQLREWLQSNITRSL